MNAYVAPSHTSARSRPWCCFRSGARSFAVDLTAVVEVIETEGVVRLPHSPAVILGLCAFRRDVIPVVRLIGGAEVRGERRGRIDVLILRTEQGLWGLRIDRSSTVVSEDVLQADQGPDADESVTAPVLIGTLRRGETACAVIDPEATWQRLRSVIEREFLVPLAAAPADAPVAAAAEVFHTEIGTGGAG